MIKEEECYLTRRFTRQEEPNSGPGSAMAWERQSYASDWIDQYCKVFTLSTEVTHTAWLEYAYRAPTIGSMSTLRDAYSAIQQGKH